MPVYVPKIIDNLNSTSSVDGLSANQGRILRERQGVLDELETEAKDNLVDAINELEEKVNVLIVRLQGLIDLTKTEKGD